MTKRPAIAALLLLLLLLAACKAGGEVPGGALPSLAGSWRWVLAYDDGTDSQFTMQLSETATGRYNATVSGDSVGTVTFNGTTVTWVWQRSNGRAIATGSYRSSPQGWDGTGVDEMDSGGSDGFDFTVGRL